MISKVLIMSDVHLCHGEWHGISSENRMTKMIEDLNKAYENEPYDAIFFLGDYSLDYWKYEKSGSFLYQGVSNTHKLITDYLPRLSCPAYYMIPGNHEQYGHELWKKLTCFERQFAVYQKGFLFLMLDTFGGDLDPQTDSDGTYTPVDVDYVQTQMALYPDTPVLLCSHFFDLRHESDEFKQLVQKEKRILGLFCGHDHTNRIEAHPALGGKLIIHDGHFSYAGYRQNAVRCPWGWLEVKLFEEGITCTYNWPESVMEDNNGVHSFPAGQSAMIQLQFDADKPFPRMR